MRKKHCSTLLLAASALFFSCKKDKNGTTVPDKLYSKWSIGTDTFTTNSLGWGPSPTSSLYIGFDGINSDGLNGAFSLHIKYDAKPLANDSFPIYGISQNPQPGTLDPVMMNFNNASMAFFAVYDSSNSYLYTNEVNGKLKITLPPTWLRKVGSDGQFTNDSALVQGVFYEP